MTAISGSMNKGCTIKRAIIITSEVLEEFMYFLRPLVLEVGHRSLPRQDLGVKAY